MVAAVAITRMDFTATDLREGRSVQMTPMRRAACWRWRWCWKANRAAKRRAAAAWTGRFYAIGSTAITPKVCKACTIEPLPARSRGCRPSKSARWPIWFAAGQPWPSMAWCAGGGLTCRG
jgi:hypothetical protein